MWPIPTLEKELCLISFTPDSVACSWIQKAKNNSPALVLCAYKRFLLDDAELECGIVFNPTVIKKHLISFLSEHDKRDAFVMFSIKGSVITEHIITVPMSTPQCTDLGITPSSNTLWGYHYLYPDDHGQFVFYVYTVPRSLVLQYQLLAVTAQINLMTITTQTLAQLNAYKHIFGAVFRRSQLAIDMAKHNNNIKELISVDTLKRIIQCPLTIALDNDHSYITAACGLFFDERIRV